MSTPSEPKAEMAGRATRVKIVVRRVFTVIVAIVLAVAVAFAALVSAGDMQVRTRVMRQGDAPRIVTYNGRKYELNPDIVNFLVLGFDGRNKEGMDGQTDVFMVAAINRKTGDTKVITVPRDSIVESPYYVGDVMLEKKLRMPLCLTYAFSGGGQFGAKTASNEVSEILGGVPIPNYYMINYKGMPDINDAIGGVPLTPIQSVPETPIEQGKPIVLKGWLAERYVRWRDHDTLQSPMDRQKREMHYARAFMAQAKRQIVRNPGVVANVLGAAKKWSMTNADISTLSYYGATALRGDLGNLQVETLPGKLVRAGVYAEFHLDMSGVYKIVIDTYYRPVK